MRIHIRHVGFLLLSTMLAGCSAGSPGVASAFDTASAAASPSAKAAAASQGSLDVLPVPAGATPWKSNTSAPMSRAAFVHVFYIQNAWTDEEAQYSRRGFVSGLREGWINADGPQQSITIARFATAAGAASTLDDLKGSWKQQSKPVTMLADPAIGAVGMSNPTLDSLGNARVEFAATIGDYMIRVQEFTAATPDPADAKALLQKQYDVLKNGS